MTKDQIIAQLRADNPTTKDDFGNVHGPGSDFYEALIEQWADAYMASLPPAGRKVWPTVAAFLREFSMPELAAIALSTNPTIAALRLVLASWPGQVWSDNEQIQIGLDALVSTGIIDQSRRDEIEAIEQGEEADA